MFSSYFTPIQQATLALAIALALVAIVLHAKGRATWALVLLTTSALVLRLFAVFLDPFLNYWDECFHALVAKNMIAHPFTPMLYTNTKMPLTSLWSENHFWVHKPPFFMWLMAASMKFFGATPYAGRLPGALLSTLLVPVVYRMAVLLINRRVAFPAAVFTSLAYLQQELVAGAVTTDQNDAVFIGLVACSWLAFLEFMNDQHWRWVLLIGLTGTCAVLTKWFVGFSVYLPWGLVLATKRGSWRDFRYFLAAFAITLTFAGAWVLHIYRWFPQEAALESSANWLRITTPLDGHRGPWTYHFDVISDLVPPFAWWSLIPALVWFWISLKRTEHRIFLASLFIAVHLLFAIAQTKTVCYTMVLFPLYMIAVGHAFISALEMIGSDRVRAWSHGIALVFLSGFMLNIEATQLRHTINPISERWEQHFRQQQMGAITAQIALAAQLHDPAREVLFHVPPLHHLQFMFTYDYSCWYKMPKIRDVERLRASGYAVYALQDSLPLDSFPPDVIVIPDSIVRFPRIERL